MRLKITMEVGTSADVDVEDLVQITDYILERVDDIHLYIQPEDMEEYLVGLTTYRSGMAVEVITPAYDLGDYVEVTKTVKVKIWGDTYIMLEKGTQAMVQNSYKDRIVCKLKSTLNNAEIEVALLPSYIKKIEQK